MNTPERDRELGHAEDADGIEEYDNALPTWWIGLFIGCIVWAGYYAVDYHGANGRSQTGEYAAEVAAALVKWPAPHPVAPSPSAGGTADDPVLVAAGKEVFATSCVGCHGATATGGVGPNLTDATWIHGGKLGDITKVVNEGVPAKGMITWGPILGPEKVAQVSSYVHGLGGGQ
jgi:cytochrome c oxidase cbb3-type subunit 3